MYLEYIINYNPVWINTSPCILGLFYSYMVSKKIKFPKSIKYIEVSGEYFDKTNREKYEEYFKIPITNQYGCRESNAIAIECENKHLHCLPNTYVEIVDEDGQNIGFDKHGHVIITNLINKAMPIIRYDIGDLGLLRKSSCCSCGSTEPIIELSSCREADLIYLENGGRMYCMFFTYIIESVNALNKDAILQYQVIQNNINDFTVKLALKTENIDKNKLKNDFCEKTKSFLNNKTNFNFIFTKYLFPNDQTGKLKYFVNKMKEGTINV